jgi:hypothetical protein
MLTLYYCSSEISMRVRHHEILKKIVKSPLETYQVLFSVYDENTE